MPDLLTQKNRSIVTPDVTMRRAKLDAQLALLLRDILRSGLSHGHSNPSLFSPLSYGLVLSVLRELFSTSSWILNLVFTSGNLSTRLSSCSAVRSATSSVFLVLKSVEISKILLPDFLISPVQVKLYKVLRSHCNRHDSVLSQQER